MNIEIKKWLEQGKDIGKKILFPKTWIVAILFNVSVILLIYSLAVDGASPFIQYPSYLLSAYTLAIVGVRIPAIVKRVKAWLYANPYTLRLIQDKPFRILVGLFAGLGINVCFGLFKVVLGIVYDSKWFVAVGGYYMLLSVIRVLLLRGRKHSLKQETPEQRRLYQLKAYRACGVLMVGLNLTMTGLVFQMIWWGQSFSYPGFVIYASAAYAFYSMGMAIKNLVKYWKVENPIFSAAKRLSFATAMVSILALQTAMISQFGVDSGVMFEKIMNTLTGSVVCMIILFMACSMVINANDEIIKVKSKAVSEEVEKDDNEKEKQEKSNT